ncbi:MAG: choice-of-anchor D domain-containing protein [Candidatus Kapabacteria bacterium]|nr:choice-of-anchor D domain-containing protein [Candidatus Kapabacteria bacterium]
MVALRIILVVLTMLTWTGTASSQYWKKVNLPAPYSNGYWLDIFFLPSNPNYGWAVDQMGGYIIRTTDGGTTWQGTNVGAGRHLEYVQFLDTQNGYVTGPGGAWKSTDGGVTWTNMLPAGATVWGGWFRDVNNGWMTGGSCGNNMFYRTQNGGQTWTSFTNTTRTQSKMSDPLWTSDMPANHVYAVGNQTLWRSTDDGATWNVFATIGNTNPWMEELAKFGNSWLVPMSPDGCPPGTNNAGMRFSDDNGSTWREFLTGKQMFGSFLLSAQAGWASGYNKGVYYTGDGGRTWQERTCGIDDGDALDDIFFIDADKGWVVGDNIYRLAPPVAEFTRERMAFGTSCPDVDKYDTVWITNKNFFAAGLSAAIGGTDADLFSIVGTVPATVSSCQRVGIIVKYRPTRNGAHTANLTVTMTTTDTTHIIPLSGDRRDRAATPADTVVTMRVRVGTVSTATLRWRSVSVPLEDITNVTRISGDTSIALFGSSYPVTIFADGALLYVTANPKDTGWTEARFRVRLGPCVRDTIITVRVYGLSPIIRSIKTLETNSTCSVRDTFYIPVGNTGNYELTVNGMRMLGTYAGAFRILGWTSGRNTPPRVIPPLQADTVIVVGTPITGDDRATLEIDHDDNTKTRGNVDPWNVELRMRSSRANVTSRTSTIDVGTVCVGESIQKTIDLLNDGVAGATVELLRAPSYVVGVPPQPFNLAVGTSRPINVTITPAKRGAFADTIQFLVMPCNDTVRIVVRGAASVMTLRIDPRAIIDSVRRGSSITRQATINVDSIDRAQVTQVYLEPTHPNLKLTTPPLPATVTQNVPMPVSLTWTGVGTEMYRGVLIATATGVCDDADTIPVEFTTYLTDVILSKRLMQYGALCEPTASRDTILVSTVATTPQTLQVPTIAPADGRFVVIEPTAPVEFTNATPARIIVEYRPQSPGRSQAVMTVPMQPDDRQVTVDLDGRFDIAVTTVSDTLIDFGVVDACQPKMERMITVRNDGTVVDTVDLQLVDDVTGLSFATQMLIVGPGQQVQVRAECEPSLLPSGVTVSERIILNSRVCPVTYTVRSTAQGVGGQLAVTPRQVVMTATMIGTSKRATITVTNSGSAQRRITAVTVSPVGPWSAEGISIPQTLQAGDTVTFDVVYAPSAVGKHLATVTLIDSGTCEVRHTVDLVGEATDKVVTPELITVRIDDYRQMPGDRITVPVHWTRDASAAQIDRVEITIKYNPLLFEVDSIVAGTWPGVTGQFAPGVVKLTAQGQGPVLGRQGVVAAMRGLAKSALPDSTPFTFATVALWAVEPTTVNADDGSLVVDACGPRFMIKVGPIRSIRALPPHPFRDVMRFNVETSADAVIDVEVLDAVGNIVHASSGLRIMPPDATVAVPVHELASGYYIVRFRTEQGIIATHQGLIVR